MSIFKHQDLDKVLLGYLPFEDLIVLSQVNRYYYNATKNVLAPLREFNKIKSTLAIEIPIDFGTIIITSKYLETYDVITRVIIQAHIYGNLDVIKYVTKNNKHVKTIKVVPVICETKTSSIMKFRSVITLLAIIAISKKRLDILSFVVNHYGSNIVLSHDYLLTKYLSNSGYKYTSEHLNESIIRILHKKIDL